MFTNSFFGQYFYNAVMDVLVSNTENVLSFFNSISEDIATQPTGSWPDGLGATWVKR